MIIKILLRLKCQENKKIRLKKSQTNKKNILLIKNKQYQFNKNQKMFCKDYINLLLF
jgi:hypothetical protein